MFNNRYFQKNVIKHHCYYERKQTPKNIPKLKDNMTQNKGENKWRKKHPTTICFVLTVSTLIDVDCV